MVFGERLGALQLVVQNQDNREHDLLDSGDYAQFQGGMAAAVRHFSGAQPALYHGDHSNPQAPRIHSLQEEISRVVRARVVNPKWLEGIRRHGYKGAFEIAATVDYLFAFDATARVVGDHQYELVADAYVDDDTTRDFLNRHNPAALRDICERLLEAMQRGLWQEPGAYRAQLENHLLDTEQLLERGR
jgi:cobaltochelatase CobN